jgi:aminoglycoside phosphotransferase (APT) family kinase protein
VTRTPLFLAALASAAVPGLDPVSVEGVRTRAGGAFDVAFVTDTQDRRWVIKAPLTQGAGAELEAVAALGHLLGRRLDLAMPMVRGEVPVPEGRAIVYLRLPGRPIDFGALPPGDLADGLGRALAHIHNIELAVFEEAGRPVYDAESHRRRQLSELDRAAATGHVPTNLLTRWEQRLEDISLWRFAPTAVHGSFVGDNVLASFDDEDRAETGEVRGVLGWEESRIGDPADDFADLLRWAPPDAFDVVLRTYAQSRVERPDGNLLARARLAAEMTPMRVLLRALASSALDVVEEAAESLRALDERASEEDERRVLEADPDWDATQPHQPFPHQSQTPATEQATDQSSSPIALTSADRAPRTQPSASPIEFELDEADETRGRDEDQPLTDRLT